MGNAQFDRQTIIDAVTNKSIAWISGSDSSSVPVNTYSRTSIYSPTGTISRMFNAKLTWASETGMTSGYKWFIVDVQTLAGVGTGGIGMLKLSANYNGQITYDQGFIQAGTQNPSDANAFNYQIANTMFDDGRAVQMVIYNGQNAPTTATRTWDLFVEREVVSR